MSNKHTAAKKKMVKKKWLTWGNTDNTLQRKGRLKMERTVHLHLCKTCLYYIRLNKNPTGMYYKIPTIHLRYWLTIFFSSFYFPGTLIFVQLTLILQTEEILLKLSQYFKFLLMEILLDG